MGRAVAVVVAVVVVGAAGGIAGSASGPPLTKEQYVAAYNALCDASVTKTEAALGALGPNHDNEQFVHAITPIYEHRIAKTRKLVPPRQSRKRVEALLAAQRAAIDTVKANRDVLLAARGTLFAFSAGRKADRLAKQYGLESGNCLDAGNLKKTAPCPGVGPCAGQTGQPPPGGTVPPPPVPPST